MPFIKRVAFIWVTTVGEEGVSPLSTKLLTTKLDLCCWCLLNCWTMFGWACHTFESYPQEVKKKKKLGCDLTPDEQQISLVLPLKKAIKGELTDINMDQWEHFLTWMLYCMMTDHLWGQIILFSGLFRGKYSTFHHNIYPTALVNSYKIHECEDWLLPFLFILIILRFVLLVARNIIYNT